MSIWYSSIQSPDVYLRVDGIFRDISLDSIVIVGFTIAFQSSSDILHLRCSSPRSGDDLADSTHRLRITAHHGYSPGIMKDVFGRDGLRSNTRIGKRDVFRNGLV
jgi:hypothetical protein